MIKKILHILFVLGVMFSFASPAAAKKSQKEPDFIFLPKAQSHYDREGMLQASEIATLNARKHSTRRCWRSVKNALFEANLVPYRPTSKYAWQAGEELEQKFDFKKLEITDPFDAPLGSLLVYGGGGPGHVEFRIQEGFVSDFISNHPSRRPLLGVYVSRPVAAKAATNQKI